MIVPPHSPVDVAQPSCTSLLPSQSISLRPPFLLCNSTVVSLPLSQIFCGMPPSINQSHGPPITQPITDGTFIFPIIQSLNPSKQYAETVQLPPGSSSLSPSHLQHQTQCLLVFHKTIQQFHQHLKAKQLDRKTLQIFVLGLQNDFPLLRYLLFSSVGTNPINDTSAKNSANSPPIDPNPNASSNALLFSCAAESSVRRSTPEGAVGPPRAKPNNSANVDFQSSTNKRKGPLTMAQNFSSKISILEKLFTDEIANYTPIIAGIHSEYFFI